MIQITDITPYLMVVCPKCHTGQFLTQWGKRKCLYEGCGGELEIEYNLQTTTQLLEIAAKELASHKKIPMTEYRPALPYMRRYPNGDIIPMPMPPTDDPKEWAKVSTYRLPPPKRPKQK